MDNAPHQSACVTSPLVDKLAVASTRPNARFEMPRSDDQDACETYLPSDMLSLEIGRYAAERITPDQLAAFKVFIQRLGDYQPSPYVVEWSHAVDEGASSVSRILRDPTNYGQTMRSIISFRPLVARDELAAIRHNYFKESHGANALHS